MEIVYKQGNVLECSEPWLLHGCNAQGVMGSGVAKGIKDKYYSAYLAYKASEAEGGMRLGVVTYAVQDNGLVVFNGITQEYYGRNASVRYVSYSAVEDVIWLINKYAHDVSKIEDVVISVAMPKIGAGLGGGDWDTIAEIIEAGSTNFQPVVYTL